jgi:hypothetical protein
MTRFDHESREVRSADPSLSPETNRRLTAELRDAVGDETAEVPRDRPATHRERHATHGTAGASLSDNRSTILIAALVLLVIGAIVWVTTGSWWAMAVAVVLDLLAVLWLASTTIGMTRNVEHASPELSARLEEEGVGDPDGLMTDLVKEYSTDGEHEQRTAVATEDQPRATREQGRAQTPSGDPSRPTGPDRG